MKQLENNTGVFIHELTMWYQCKYHGSEGKGE
jgi:hypothetical protein